VLDSSEGDDRHGALLDADMTADALILMEHQLKHGETGAPRSWTSNRTAWLCFVSLMSRRFMATRS
jgi:hypothetical protein